VSGVFVLRPYSERGREWLERGLVGAWRDGALLLGVPAVSLILEAMKEAGLSVWSGEEAATGGLEAGELAASVAPRGPYEDPTAR